MNYDWIFFDLDNTLLDFYSAARQAFSASLLPFGLRERKGMYAAYLQVNHAAWRDFEKGKIDAATLRRRRFADFFKLLDIRGVEAGEFNAIYMEQLVGHSEMLEGAIPLLNALHGKVRMAAVTNGLKEAQRPRLHKLNISHYFETIVVSDEIGHSKPDTAYFDVVMQDCGHPTKERVLMVGDSLTSDVQGGLDYGLPTCWCNLERKGNSSNLNPHFEIHHLSQLPPIIGL